MNKFKVKDFTVPQALTIIEPSPTEIVTKHIQLFEKPVQLLLTNSERTPSIGLSCKLFPVLSETMKMAYSFDNIH